MTCKIKCFLTKNLFTKNTNFCCPEELGGPPGKTQRSVLHPGGPPAKTKRSVWILKPAESLNFIKHLIYQACITNIPQNPDQK